MKTWKTTALAGALAISSFGAGLVARSAHADQPEMKTALQDLRAAKTALESAGHEHGGHRRKALKAVEAAIVEVEEGIAWTEQHPKGEQPQPKGPPQQPQPKGPQPK